MAKRITLPGVGTKNLVTQRRVDKKPRPTGFQKGNKFAFKKAEDNGGQVDSRIDPHGSRKNENTLLSKNVLIQLNNRAPDKVSSNLGLQVGSSWSQAIAAFLLTQAFHSENWRDAISLIMQLTEHGRHRILVEELEAMRAQMIAGGTGPKVVISFSESNGDGQPTEKSLAEFADHGEEQEEGRKVVDAPLRRSTDGSHLLGPG